MKSSTRLFFLVGLLAAAASVVFLTKKDGTRGAYLEQREFAISDTGSINKLFLADTDGRTITLERKTGGPWRVNDEFEAIQQNMDLLLKTILMIKVKAPVPETAFENLVRQIAGKHVKVEIYTGDNKPAKTWYIGNPTKDHYGTYMILETPEHGMSTVPFIMELPGFYGYLSARFHLDLNSWRNKMVFNTKRTEIQHLDCIFGDNPEYSFMVDQVGDFTYKLAPLNQPQVVMPYDTLRLGAYLGIFEDIRCENFVITLDQAIKDSILNSPFFYRYTLTDKSGVVTDLKIYKKPPREENIHASGDKMLYDPEYFYAVLNDDRMMILQNFVFEKMFVPKKAFQQTVSFVNNSPS